jgi:hypothetical protein
LPLHPIDPRRNIKTRAGLLDPRKNRFLGANQLIVMKQMQHTRLVPAHPFCAFFAGRGKTKFRNFGNWRNRQSHRGTTSGISSEFELAFDSWRLARRLPAVRKHHTATVDQ